MMEHTTDRLFWTLSAIIIAALLLTIGVKVFPKAASEVIHPMSGVVQSADKSTSALDNAISGANADKLDWQTGTNGGTGNVATGTDSTARDQAINNQLTKQNQALQSYQSQLNDAVNHINDLNTRLVNLQNDKTGTNNSKDISDLKSLINGYSTQITNYQSQISSLNDQITQLRNSQQTTASSGAANGQSISALQKANDDNNSLIKQLQQQIQSYGTNQGNDENLITNLQNQVNGMSNQIQQNLTSSSVQIANLTQQLQAAQAAGGNNASQIQTLTSQLQTLTNQYQTLSSTVASQGSSVTQLQNDDIYKINYLNASSDLSKIKTAGTYIWTDTQHNIQDLKGTDNLGQLLNTIPDNWPSGFDRHYATLIVSPQLGTWQTQTLIGANGITLIRSMNNGQDFSTAIDARGSWHFQSGNDTQSLTFKGDVTGVDYNTITQTGIYSTHGAPSTNASPTIGNDYNRVLEVINNNNGLIIQRETTQDSDEHTRNQQIMSQRICNNGVWQPWTQIDNPDQSFVFNNDHDLLDAFNMPDGVYNVGADWHNAPPFFNGWGILKKESIGNPYSWPDVRLTLSDAGGNTWINIFGTNTWQGWTKTNNKVYTMGDNTDLNAQMTTGDYESWNSYVINGPYNGFRCWFQMHVQNSGGFTTQVITTSWGQVWTRTYSGYPASWNNWTTTSNGH